MKTKDTKEYDVAVIGGGPAGMMAAGRAAELGANVVLIEKNNRLGEKLLITGGGRCNMLNATLDPRTLLSKFKDKGKFLFSTFSQHGAKDSLDFFESHGVKTKVENEGRVFPITNSAKTVWECLLKYMKDGKVKVVSNLPATNIHARDGEIVGINTAKDTIIAQSYILATGGASHPETGSTGEAFKWLESIGHTVRDVREALVPIKIKEKWVKDLAGISHQHVGLSIYENGKQGESQVGRMVFTDFGMSGPMVLNLSRDVRESMQYGPVELSFDLLPDIKVHEMDKKLLELFAPNQNKKIKNALADLIPPSFVGTVLELSKVDLEKEVNLIKREERITIGKTLKDMRMTPIGFLGTEKAIATSGGVALEEIDFRTMQSRLFPNLYIVGDLLDIERPSGGYSLQLCWTTGFVAGTSTGKIKRV